MRIVLVSPKTVSLVPNSRATISVTAILKGCLAFATAVGQQATEIDGKVCAKKKVHNEAEAGRDVTKETNGTSDGGRWSCVDYSGTGSNTDKNRKMDPHDTKGLMWRFGDLSKNETAQDGKTSTDGNLTNRGWPGTGAKADDTAHGMAEDINKLQRHEKTKVAGLLSKAVSGAEVVEIRAVSTTSVMLNACYDL